MITALKTHHSSVALGVAYRVWQVSLMQREQSSRVERQRRVCRAHAVLLGQQAHLLLQRGQKDVGEAGEPAAQVTDLRTSGNAVFWRCACGTS